MAAVLGVDPAYLKAGPLKAILALPQMAGFDDAYIQDGIDTAVATVQRDFGTRFVVTHFLPNKDAAAQGDPGTASEFEPLYDWPGRIPGDGYPRIKVRVRPIVDVVSLVLEIPGAILSRFNLPTDWLRIDRVAHEIIVAPTGGSAPYALAFNVGVTRLRVPASAYLEYHAGLDDTTVKKWPLFKRLVTLEATLFVLPTMAMWMNPGVFSSESADGLSQSRSSGYVFKDLEERLKSEVDDVRARILAQWDGPELMVL